MGIPEDGHGNKDVRTEKDKSWLYIIGFLMFFLLIGSCVKWLSAIFHGPH